MERHPRKRGRPRLQLSEEEIVERKAARQRYQRERYQMRRNSSLGTGGTQPISGTISTSGTINIATTFAANNDVVLPETQPDRSEKNQKKKMLAFATNNEPLDIGKPDKICGFCTAHVWELEFTGRYSGEGPKGYSICCCKSRVQLPLPPVEPPELAYLLNSSDSAATSFRRNIRLYNSVFSFTSLGGKFDESVNDGGGPFVYRLNGQTYHRIGSLLPPDNVSPMFAQFYMFDGEDDIHGRLNFPRQKNILDPAIVRLLRDMLDRENALVKIFRQVRDRFPFEEHKSMKLRLVEKRTTDGRLTSSPPPNSFEFAALIPDSDFSNPRDIIVEYKNNGLSRISELHPSYMALMYVMLFPYGNDGFRLNILHRTNTDSDENSDESEDEEDTVSRREYHAYGLQYREGGSDCLLKGGRLFLQFVVDAWSCIEHDRLNWVMNNQAAIRSDLYNNIVDSLKNGDICASNIGKRIILPSSFTGGSRYQHQNYQDSLAVCSHYGHPDLFITFTCNPKWKEISYALEKTPHSDASVRPDIVSRVFKIKLDLLNNDLINRAVLGRVLAVVYTIEFQKRGLPHAHMVVWLHKDDKITCPDEINEVICAEIPDKNEDPIAYETISQFMMHGACGEANPKCPCMKGDKCSKYFPKPFASNTIIGDDGFALYRRRDTGRTVERNGIQLDNRHVVPYNRGLVVKYQAHINIEWCNRGRSIKYLFKYIGKGPDTATMAMEKNVTEGQNIIRNNNVDTTAASMGSDNVDNQNISPKKTVSCSHNSNEITQYLTCRYVSAAESCWRIFKFPIHYRKPFVQRLYFHLEDQQQVQFRDNETIPSIIRRVDPDATMFVQWMINNQTNPIARSLTFVEYPSKFWWNKSTKQWTERKKKTSVVGRMVYAHPASGERFYMRLLLNIIRGAQSFEDIRTVDNVVYNTYKDACFHRGLLDSDIEWHHALEEAAIFCSASQIRDLFVIIIIFCEVGDAFDLWDKHWKDLSDDVQYVRRKVLQMPDLLISEHERKSGALKEIDLLLRQFGKSLKDFPSLPQPDTLVLSRCGNRLLLEELLYDRAILAKESETLISKLNTMQTFVFNTVVSTVAAGTGGLFFVYGHGGTGKIFLWCTIIKTLRTQGKIVLAVASSGIASLLVDGGRTAHSRFKIPIDVKEHSCCDILKNSFLADLICHTDLIVWDEAPMNHRFVFEAVDRTFRDILGKVNPNADSAPFGGIPVLLGGDFRQILPVVPKKGREEIVAASISKSYLWKSCKVFSLCENMRIDQNIPPVVIDNRVLPFRDWVLSIGDGAEPTYTFEDNDDPSWIKLPKEVTFIFMPSQSIIATLFSLHEVLLPEDQQNLASLISILYPNLNANYNDLSYLRDRAILTPLNDDVENINKQVQSLIQGNVRVYRSVDSISKVSMNVEGNEALYPTEFLNSLKFSGLPNHKIELKIGAPIMLLRNINPKNGLCNGTRLIVTQLCQFVIEGIIITGKKTGNKAYIPRIYLSPSDTTLPFVFRRKQFPVCLCYAMTINKSQGQTVKNVGLYLPKPVFSHGQLYVAISRVTSPNGLKILCEYSDKKFNGYTKNIVYKEIFNNIL